MKFMSTKAASVFKKNCVACGTCTKVCPKHAINIYKGGYANVETNLCVGCGKCAQICPTECILIKERNSI